MRCCSWATVPVTSLGRTEPRSRSLRRSLLTFLLFTRPFFYKTSQAPQYPLGIWSMIVSHLTEVVIILILRVHLSRENKRRDRIQSQMVGGLEGRDLDATAFSDMTGELGQSSLSNVRYIADFWSRS